jgi:glutamyl-Q tRNA(Asp) synthetase
MARAQGGRFLVRLEDIDRTRSRTEWERQIFEDLAWLGLRWEEPVLRQSQNLPAYRQALETLWRRGLLYPCRCNRRDIREAASAPQEGAPRSGPDGLVYPGTCRDTPRATGAPLPEGVALRLDLQAAARELPDMLSFTETGLSDAPQTVEQSLAALQVTTGDVVLARREMGTSYHLSVVIDDAAQQITHVVRGRDLFDATMIHVVLQHLLALPTPCYHHHRLIRDAEGRRLAKRDDARALSKYRAEGASPDEIRRIVGLPPQASGAAISTSPPSSTAV